MDIKPLGDSALLIELGQDLDEAVLARAVALARRLEADRLPGVIDVVPAFASVAVYYDPSKVTVADGELPSGRVTAWVLAEKKGLSVRKLDAKRDEVVVPVCYGGEYGPDLELVARQAKLSHEQVVKLHAGASYRVGALGFMPGFPYLIGLPKKLHTPRRATPRVTVPAGSVGIGGVQTGIYPLESPGGWQLIGRTALRLFDPSAAQPTLLQPGDRVRFQETKGWKEPAASRSRSGKMLTASTEGAGVIEVVRPGSLTTVQDLGRTGFQSLGIAPGGAMDVLAARVANLIVGNDEDEAVLELSLTGPELRFEHDAVIALTGAGVKGLPRDRPVRVAAGERVQCASLVGGARAYLAVAGGLRVPRVLGSTSTALRAGFGGLGGRALQAGDRLAFGTMAAAPTGGSWSAGVEPRLAGAGKSVEVRFVEGVQAGWFSAEMRRRLETSVYHVTARSDRMGMRLSGPDLTLAAPREMISQPVVTGSIQVPPDGQPIVLLADRQTIGGYPQIGHVASVDLPRLAQARTGAEVKFIPVTHTEAERLWLKQARDLAWLRTGLMCRK